MNDGQKTPRGHPNFNSYIQNLCVLVLQTDRQTDGRTDGQRNDSGVGLPQNAVINGIH
jgi:hypothetical protein